MISSLCLNVRQYHPIQSLGEEKNGAKCVLLKPGIACDGRLWERHEVVVLLCSLMNSKWNVGLIVWCYL